jgi:hypothetical protein
MDEQPTPPNGRFDVVAYRIVVSCLGGCVLMTGAGITWLSAVGQEIPPALPALGGTALGALTGMLAAMMRRD